MKVLLIHSYYLENLFPEKDSHSQEKLYEDIVNKIYVAHNSVEDVIAMSAILKESECHGWSSILNSCQTKS